MNVCAICEQGIAENQLPISCIFCIKFFHADKELNCAEISPTEIKVVALTKVVPKLLYKCKQCSTKSDSNLNISNGRLENLLENLNKSISNFNKTVLTIQKIDEKIINIESAQNKLVKETLPSIIDRLTKLENKNINKTNNQPIGNVNNDLSSVDFQHKILAELDQQILKRKNVIVINLSDKNNLKEDLKYIKELLQKINLPSKNIKVNRIGKYFQGKNRLLKITFEHDYNAIFMIKSAKKIIKHTKEKIFITNDKTEEQINYERNIKLNFNERSKDEENLCLRYVNSILTIVTKEKEVNADDTSNTSLSTDLSITLSNESTLPSIDETPSNVNLQTQTTINASNNSNNHNKIINSDNQIKENASTSKNVEVNMKQMTNQKTNYKKN